MGKRATLVKALEEFLDDNPLNTMKAHDGMKIYDAPLVGFANADDPVFLRLKDPEVIGDLHRLPDDWLGGAKTVISFFLPFSGPIRKSDPEKDLLSEEWRSSRIDGEQFRRAMRKFLVDTITDFGYDAVCPVSMSEYVAHEYKSNWSERHVAYAAGLGTFGLNRSLITEKGCAGRYASVVTTLEIPATPRTAATFYEACPFLTDGSCGECIARCPAGAISAEGKDNRLCSDYIYNVVMPLYAPDYGCAKCQTGVPCEFQPPKKH